MRSKEKSLTDAKEILLNWVILRINLTHRGILMNNYILEHIPFQADLAELAKTLRLKPGSPMLDDLRQMAIKAQVLANPKVIYRVSLVEVGGDRTVNIDGAELTSRVLRVNLEKAHRVFPFVATCGIELEEWSVSIDDMLERYWADVIKEMALRVALKHLNEHLIDHFQPGKISRMNPGSLPDWPLPEQQQLFALLGGGPASIGIKLTDSFLMIPIKSVSGIWFPTEESFESCLLCPREKCPGRRAPYEPDLYNQKYRQK
jgi:hypothetical protein